MCSLHLAGSNFDTRAWTFNLKPQFVQHIANAWTERVSPTQQVVHVVYVGYDTMPDFCAWSGPGSNFEDIDPDEQPPSLLMHATLRISSASDDIQNHDEVVSQRRNKLSLLNPLSNPLLKPFLKASVQMPPGSSPSELGVAVASAQPSPQSSWDDWNDRMPTEIAPAMGTTLRPSTCYQPLGCTRVVSRRVLEFPCVNPQREALPARYVFGAAALHPHRNRPQQAIAMYDLHTGSCEYWSRGWRYYVGEPEMIPSLPECRRQGVEKELDGARPFPAYLCARVTSRVPAIALCCSGWLLSICYDGERHVSEVVVLDASNISGGPVAWAELPVVVPHGLHGTWVPSV